MTPARLALAFAARGRILLVAGVVLGIAVPPLARAMLPWVTPLIFVLLFLSALRVGPAGMAPRGGALRRGLGQMLAMQLALPLAVLALFWLAGVAGHMLAIAVVLVLAAPPLTGSPGLAVLSGADPAPALRQVVIGTAALPVTSLIVLGLIPFPGEIEAGAPFSMALRLVGIIGLAGAMAWLIRRSFPYWGEAEGQQIIDGGLALAMGLVVIGLMAATGPAIMAADPALIWSMGLACGLCFGLQVVTFRVMRGRGGDDPASIALLAGNRNMVLFLGALPPDLVAGILLFVGCYQVPMYLTPLMARHLFGRRENPAPPARS
ncbi:MAG: hypothetical protein Q4G36_12755 [Paracoccus sp. (in: a-proteobacteria)]|nr:hypothetical protein [Paracoccus sp. (in: a-proteobacteria)]